ncbi:MAG: hypothetical protein HOA15_01270 [Candidatus Marinimicrobia bacterium]|jgi:hypothetical protein|nr:hypothetical protein [Candidatus Neomarinimicrobiota bacterium]MBT6840526.1 hypothetical protein [Candidatus Neomarinimicrobiota bacterium]MBT7738658.1 hypothetical protein [Candidatus Neomarinimicrobiota bacterium]
MCPIFSQPDSTIKLFPSDLNRTNILSGEVKEAVKKNESHFRAVYYPSGELKSVEFVPANWDKGRRKKVKSPSRLKLYYRNWNPKKQELIEGITKKEGLGKPHYRATLDAKGLVRDVDYFNRHGKRLWTYHMRWNDEGKSSEYDIEFYSNRNLSELNSELFAPDLSAIRPGWIARYNFNKEGITKGVRVLDQFENLYYYYQFSYGKNGFRSKYYRADSLLVGSHTVRFTINKKPLRITYYNENGIMKNAVAYEYPKDVEKVISLINSKGEVIERRIIPKKEN